MFRNIFRGIGNFFSSIFGGTKKEEAPAPQPDPAAVAAQRDAAAKDAEEKSRTQLAAQTGRGKLVNPFSGLMGVGTRTDPPFKSLF
ncbi:MAG: hypothetical protein H9535_19325 [Ignavibacteria bacterium]|nr:hypothetical protein [Ignavibacteria bacterium]